MKRLLSLLLLAALTGCASVRVLETSRVDERIGQSPQLATDSTATVGSTIFSQYRYWSKTGYRLSDDVAIRLGLGKIVARNGDFLVPAEVEGETAYCTELPSYADPMSGPIKTSCFLDRAKRGVFSSVKAAPGAIWFENQLPMPTRYEKGELIVAKNDAKKYELLYQGFSAHILRLSYREYINDLARPAYFQDASYDIATFPTEISFRSVRLVILGAGNNGIQYRVISGFE